MIKNVLMPVDLSHADRTDAMFDKIGQLAEKGDGVQITLLNVISAIPGYIAAQLPPEIGQTAEKDADSSLKALAKKHGIDKVATVRVAHGNPAQKILEVAKTDKVDLIVIGSHQPGPVDYLLGSVASRVVRHASCSVLVVR